MKVFAIKGKIQDYAWGGKSYIPSLVDLENTDNQVFAELWMGAHHRGPAKIEGTDETLDIFINHNPKGVLGTQIAEKFDNKIPFLFKILDVNKMLSIQTHPTKEQAEIGYRKENEQGVDLSARHRNFKDDNHKPEIMIALTDFWLLHGFQSAEAIEQILKSIPEFEGLLVHFEDKNIRSLYKNIMELSQEAVNDILAPLKERLERENPIEKAYPDYWAKLAFDDYTREGNFDRGIFSIYLFNLVQIEKGKAIFQDAGIPHAYLEGVNVELMANSDNVFRGGLTPKHIDVPELMRHLKTEAVTPKVFDGEAISAVEKVYRTPAPDFEVSEIKLKQGQLYQRKADAPDILIVLEGKVSVHSKDGTFDRKRGEIFFAAFDGEYEVKAAENSTLYRASVPV